MVSIIVPVYNTEKYISQCVTSVLSQTYEDWELLLMNDGSTDGSAAICDEYASFDNRIYAVHKNNTGVSDTRNQGINISQGEYVIFLDSDDYWCAPNFLSDFVEFASKNSLDVVRGDYIEVDSLGSFVAKSSHCLFRNKREQEIMSNSQFLREIIKGEYFSVLCLFRKDFLKGKEFNVDRVFLEDAEFLISSFMRNGRFAYVDNAFYAYRKHSQAVSVRYIPKKIRDAFNFTRFCFEVVDQVDDEEYQIFCAEEGARNYMYDISELSILAFEGHMLGQWIRENNLRALRRKVLRIAFQYGLRHYYKAILPVTFAFCYYYCRRKILDLVKKIWKKDK